MSRYTGSDFVGLAEHHSQAVADVKAMRVRLVQAGGNDVDGLLAKAVAREKDVRAALIEWKPTSNTEAQLKLLYLVQYLCAMRSSLDAEEMAATMQSVAHLRKK